ncbi:hypothetical protein CN090_04145 [Sinorhizobium meliloti]|nr:hypothetical protein CN090_04145 [Sinorhizobium meliloti]
MKFEFDEGQCVNHVSGRMPSIVIGRKKTARGREQYHIRTIAIGPHRFHWMLGDALVPMAGEEDACAGCRMRAVCPRAAGRVTETEKENAQPNDWALELVAN